MNCEKAEWWWSSKWALYCFFLTEIEFVFSELLELENTWDSEAFVTCNVFVQPLNSEDVTSSERSSLCEACSGNLAEVVEPRQSPGSDGSSALESVCLRTSFVAAASLQATTSLHPFKLFFDLSKRQTAGFATECVRFRVGMVSNPTVCLAAPAGWAPFWRRARAVCASHSLAPPLKNHLKTSEELVRLVRQATGKWVSTLTSGHFSSFRPRELSMKNRSLGLENVNFQYIFERILQSMMSCFDKTYCKLRCKFRKIWICLVWKSKYFVPEWPVWAHAEMGIPIGITHWKTARIFKFRVKPQLSKHFPSKNFP